MGNSQLGTGREIVVPSKVTDGPGRQGSASLRAASASYGHLCPKVVVLLQEAHLGLQGVGGRPTQSKGTTQTLKKDS